jgi:hypothetical protein
MARDCDLIAIPWTEKAGPQEPMIEALKTAAEGVWTHHNFDDLVTTASQGTPKPHGRTAYSVHLTNQRYRNGGAGVKPKINQTASSASPSPSCSPLFFWRSWARVPWRYETFSNRWLWWRGERLAVRRWEVAPLLLEFVVVWHWSVCRLSMKLQCRRNRETRQHQRYWIALRVHSQHLSTVSNSY